MLSVKCQDTGKPLCTHVEVEGAIHECLEYLRFAISNTTLCVYLWHAGLGTFVEVAPEGLAADLNFVPTMPVRCYTYLHGAPYGPCDVGSVRIVLNNRDSRP